MSMILKKCLLSLTVAASLTAVASVTAFYNVSYAGNGSRYVCRWVPGQWRHGYWVQGQRVCWWQPYRHWNNYNNYNNCRWIPGHWRNGYWVPAQKRCW